jgi:hypothetical protein
MVGLITPYVSGLCAVSGNSELSAEYSTKATLKNKRRVMHVSPNRTKPNVIGCYVQKLINFSHNNKNFKMKKELKNYLPFYLGCEISWETKDGNTGGTCELNIFRLEEFYDEEIKIKPILRPLSQLFLEIEHNGNKFIPDEQLCGRLKEMGYSVAYHNDFFSFRSKSFVPRGFSFSEYQQLLEWHFDIFGLIEAGLAVNAGGIADCHR